MKKVQEEVAIKENQSTEATLLKLLKLSFPFQKGKDFYFNSEITPKLQELYTKVGLIDPKTELIKKATPADLGQEGRFIIEIKRRTNDRGIREYSVLIRGYKLGLNTTEQSIYQSINLSLSIK